MKNGYQNTLKIIKSNTYWAIYSFLNTIFLNKAAKLTAFDFAIKQEYAFKISDTLLAIDNHENVNLTIKISDAHPDVIKNDQNSKYSGSHLME